MGLSRSTFHDTPAIDTSNAAIVSCMTTTCDSFETYGYRRVGAALRHQGLVVNGKKVRRYDARARSAAQAAAALRGDDRQQP